MHIKVYNTAPLPFMGQKRRFLKKVKQIIETHEEDVTYVDLFGGSGLLSHTVKQHRPNAKVVYNDFDGFRTRLENIPKTNALLAELRQKVIGIPKGEKIAPELRNEVLEVVKRHERHYGYVDYITLSSSLLFSMNYVLSYEELEKETFYQCIKASDYDATGYLDGVEVESGDYKAIFEKYRYNDRVVWLVDPPYLSTETKVYDTYWKLRDYLDVLNVLDNQNYVYFTSNKSNIIELCEWIETRSSVANPFHGATTTTADVQVNRNSTYTDIMLYKYDYKG